MRRRVSGLMRAPVTSLRTSDTVVRETPASLAIWRWVGRDLGTDYPFRKVTRVSNARYFIVTEKGILSIALFWNSAIIPDAPSERRFSRQRWAVCPTRTRFSASFGGTVSHDSRRRAIHDRISVGVPGIARNVGESPACCGKSCLSRASSGVRCRLPSLLTYTQSRVHVLA